MRKTLSVLALAAATTIAVLAGSGSANAATYDDARVGTVAKSDVMVPLGLNESAFQNIAKITNPDAITFSNVLTTVKDTSWTCSDGSTQHHYYTTTSKRPINATKVYNAAPGKVTGWTLNGLSTTDYGTTTGIGSDGNRFPSYLCPAGSSFTGLGVTQTHSQDVKFSYNGTSYSLPNTVVVPTA